MHAQHVAELVSAPLRPNDLSFLEIKSIRVLGGDHVAPPPLLDHTLNQEVVVAKPNLVSIVVVLRVHLHLLLP